MGPNQLAGTTGAGREPGDRGDSTAKILGLDMRPLDEREELKPGEVSIEPADPLPRPEAARPGTGTVTPSAAQTPQESEATDGISRLSDEPRESRRP